MTRLIFKICCIGALVLLTSHIYGQDIFHPWEKEQVPFDEKSIFEPADYKAYAVNEELLFSSLSKAMNSGSILSIPLADGSFGQFRISDYRIAADGFYKKYPSIKTFKLEQVDGDLIGYGDLTEKGFHASLYGSQGLIYIDPTHSNRSERAHAVYYTKDYSRGADAAVFECSTTGEHIVTESPGVEITGPRASVRSSAADSVPLRTYRMVATTTAEYSNFHGGTKPRVASALSALLVRINEVMLREFSIKYELIEGTDTLFYFNANSDPYTNGNTGALINEGAGTIPQFLGPSKYDIGHVFCTNAGGLAMVGSVCTPSKTRGVSCGSPPINDSYYIRVVAHELGHQMGSSHSFNFCRGQNESLSRGFEPGSGSTIMSYSGICGPRNVQNFTSPYYNIGSVESIVAYMHEGPGKNCAENTNQNNTKPVVNLNYEDDFYIPISTPFELHASATDAETEDLYYCWEQHDAGLINCEPGSPEGSCPAFRSLPPTLDSFRVFPELRDVVLGFNDRWEVLPTYSRSLQFACTVRDWLTDGGALDWDFVEFNATDEAGPFEVNDLNGIYEVGDPVEITWNVANTDKAPVNCQFVNIYMSTNNGQSFPHLLAKEVPNIGNITLNLPNITANIAKVKIKASDNIFFNVSGSSFRVNPASNPGFIGKASPYAQQVCLPATANIQIFTEPYLNFSEEISVIQIEGLPPTAEYVTTPANIMPGENFNIDIDFGDAEEGTYPIKVIIGGIGDTSSVRVQATLVSNDFANLKGVLPGMNAENVSELPTFKWDTIVDADQYVIEVASSPDFELATIIYQSGQIAIDSHTVSDLLPKNSLLYWRIIPVNECGEGPASPVRVFHTEAQTCENFTSNDVPKTISTAGSTELFSDLEISTSGVIADVNVKNLRGEHAYIGELIAHLISPAGTEVKLFDTDCFNFQNFHITLDDQASASLQCPLNAERTNRPRGKLSNLNGENTQGIWQIRLNDNTPGSGGRLQGWGLEICGSISIEKPTLSSDTVYVKRGEEQFIRPNNLLAEKDGVPDYQMIYTVVEGPEFGIINYGSGPLQAGSIFNQDAVNNYWLVYEHNGSENKTDFMSFTIQDQLGGWVGLDTLFFVVDSTLSTKHIAKIDFQVFPNPTHDRFTVNIPGGGQEGSMQLFNAQGQLMIERKLNGRIQYHFDCAQFPKGLYYLKVESEKGRNTERVVLQ